MIRPFYRRGDMPLQRFLADPARGDGNTADGTPGDCFRTAIAGALGLERDVVPHFVQIRDVDSGWWWELQRWALAELGAFAHSCNPRRWRELRAEGADLAYPGGGPYVVMSGPSPRGAFWHAIVGDLDLNPVHDPHPLGMGLAEVADVLLVVEADDWTPPARLAIGAGR